MNDINEERKLRAARSALVVSGRGILYLTIWNMTKTVISILYTSDWQDFREALVQGSLIGQIIGLILLALLLGLYGGIYAHVGLRAMAEGHGKHRNNGYIVIASLLTVILLFRVILVSVLWWMGKSALMNLSAVPVDLITFAAMADLTVNAVKVRRYTGGRKEGGQRHAA